MAVGRPDRVDRDKGIIYGVKILGRHSPNNHGVKGAVRTEYTRQALARAKGLYEGRTVNVDHPDRGTPGKDRSARDRIGWLSNVRDEDDGLFGDLNLVKADPLTPKLFEAAERNPSLFGLSHNAMGDGSVVNGVYVIDDIPIVRHVDIVADGGTVVSLFESEGNVKTLRQVVEGIVAKPSAKLRALLEDDNYGALPVQMDDDDPDYELHEVLADAIKAILCNDQISLSEKKTRIMKLVEVSGDTGDESDDDDQSDDDPERKRKAMAEKPNDDKGKGQTPPHETNESRVTEIQTKLTALRESLGTEADGSKKVKKLEKKLRKLSESGAETVALSKKLAELQEARRKDGESAAALQAQLDKLQLEKWVRDEAATKKVVVDEILESLVSMGTKEAIGKHLDYLAKNQAAQTPGRRPQSAPPRPVTESRNGTPGSDKPEETLAALRN